MVLEKERVLKENMLNKIALTKLNKLGGKTLVVDMIDLFLTNAPLKIREAYESEINGDILAVERAVHSLKSSAAHIGAIIVHELAEKIELMASQKKSENISLLIRDLEEAFLRVKSLLEWERDEGQGV